ncbi:hypothetical protein AVEN_118588-1 [Araneus ventricosus]|uniref:Uncharacterized protein n=1 Tax=Araneus ventricosus TaxID=182803 RepID=A0A4Y2AZ94_ARAVE|nr:hypothetical protein AVEN_118588-1 [Araneus ventricosus]
MTMDLTLLKTQRQSFRTSFTVCAKKIDDELLKAAPELKQLSILKSQISDKFARLETCQAEITNLILKTEDADRHMKKTFCLLRSTEIIILNFVRKSNNCI